MVHAPKETRKKWDPKTIKIIFVSYCENTKGYRMYDEHRKQMYKSRNVVFLEETVKNNCVTMPFTDWQQQGSDTKIDNYIEQLEDTVDNIAPENDQLFDATSEVLSSEQDCDPEYAPNRVVDIAPVSKTTLRPRNNKPTTYLCYKESLNTAPSLKDPESLEEALSGPTAKEWTDAMNTEYDSLL
ncbi:Retrovirus-related Pol polyprotein from transposon TNT 1-94 [Eumeta japonica]|uniref:Retrovirus-related Pol polyprotein from transposon TNT 1-94 n=1 Tax=Eumeta variegata TaxID=151549 RepID=A0A4C1V770_EUMVA|nr:Retrovirus-related Pol polyprotein from transposon TNT 1-94 [Eumeta japonica]